MFDNTFGKCGPIFKILSPGDSYENSLYAVTNIVMPFILVGHACHVRNYG